METFSPPPPSRGKNAACQEIEKLLGGRVDITAVPADDYGTKFSTMVASDSLPDLFMYPESGGVDNKAAFLQAKCADLTPHLAGDAVKDYPNLAAIPKGAWQGAIFGGKLYGIPIARTGTHAAPGSTATTSSRRSASPVWTRSPTWTGSSRSARS